MELKEGCEARCPGCRHRDLSLVESQALKHRFLERSLAGSIEEFGGPSVDRWGYRDRTCLRAAWFENRWTAGLQRRSSIPRTRPEVVSIPRCPVQTPAANAALAAVLDGLTREFPGPQLLPLGWVVVSGKLMTLVLKTKRNPDLVERLGWTRQALEPWIHGFFVNWHPSTGRQVFSPDWQCVWGTPRARQSGGAWYGPDSFGQLQAGLHSASLDRATAHLAPGPGDGVLDLCCGMGLSLARWKERGSAWLGVELGGEALSCAALNLGPSENLLRGKCSERLPQIRQWVRGLPSGAQLLVYANPPRTGLATQVIQWLSGPDCPAVRMAYLSCSPGTLARDLERLDWKVETLVPYDFFPGTHHVETLALLSRTR